MSTVDDIARAAGVTRDELRTSLANAVDHAKSTGMTDEEFVLWIWHAGFITAREHLAGQEATDAEVEAAARGLYENHVSQNESEHERASWPAWEDHEQADADEWRDEARSALRAAARVRTEQER